MGIKQLADLIAEEAPAAVSTESAASYTGKVLAIDASIFIHQFDSALPALTNRKGENISVLQGLFQRTAFMLQNGIKPLYVFDGIPPENKRFKDTKEGKVQFKRRVNPSLTPDRFKDLKTLLSHLGVPYIQAPSEAEATCAHLVVNNVAWGAVTEDMDALPFNCHRLIRNLKADKKIKVQEYNLPEILKRLKLSREQFVDLCILLGCDYTEKIRGLGRKKAFKMIQQYKSIEGILQVIQPKDRIPPEFDYITARRLFLSPDIKQVDLEDLRWTPPNDEKVLEFLSREKFMKKDRVIKVLKKLHTPQTQKRKLKTTGTSPSKQMKIGNFFPVKKSVHQNKSTLGTHHTSSMEDVQRE
ncbi:flap endonuclease 1-like isoform X2 [Eleutherodactylus coqui]|uniref:flap endonuclease 1-like isoform X2 n=1 Tax=Eleutherodactylus coqui TaxID=57060 RepID=UPI0034636CB0